MPAAAILASPSDAPADSGAQNCGLRELVTVPATLAASLAPASKTLDNENDFMFVVQMFSRARCCHWKC